MVVGRDRCVGDSVRRCLNSDGGYLDLVNLDEGMRCNDEETTTGVIYSGRPDVYVSRRGTSL